MGLNLCVFKIFLKCVLKDGLMRLVGLCGVDAEMRFSGVSANVKPTRQIENDPDP